MGCDSQPDEPRPRLGDVRRLLRDGHYLRHRLHLRRRYIEKLVGQWVRNCGVRGRRDDHQGRTPRTAIPESLIRQLEESLERQGTDYADLYMMHRDNTDIPVGEFVDVMDEHLRAGRIRAYGGSNWTPERVDEASAYAKANGRTGFTILSNHFGLAEALDVPEDASTPPIRLQGMAHRPRHRPAALVLAGARLLHRPRPPGGPPGRGSCAATTATRTSSASPAPRSQGAERGVPATAIALRLRAAPAVPDLRPVRAAQHRRDVPSTLGLGVEPQRPGDGLADCALPRDEQAGAAGDDHRRRRPRRGLGRRSRGRSTTCPGSAPRPASECSRPRRSGTIALRFAGLVEQGPTTLGLVVGRLSNTYYAGSALPWCAPAPRTAGTSSRRGGRRPAAREGRRGPRVAWTRWSPAWRPPGSAAAVCRSCRSTARPSRSTRPACSSCRARRRWWTSPSTCGSGACGAPSCSTTARAGDRPAHPAPSSAPCPASPRGEVPVRTVHPHEARARRCRSPRRGAPTRWSPSTTSLAVRMLRALRRPVTEVPSRVRVTGVDGLEISTLVSPSS